MVQVCEFNKQSNSIDISYEFGVEDTNGCLHVEEAEPRLRISWVDDGKI